MTRNLDAKTAHFCVAVLWPLMIIATLSSMLGEKVGSPLTIATAVAVAAAVSVVDYTLTAPALVKKGFKIHEARWHTAAAAVNAIVTLLVFAVFFSAWA